MVAVEMLEKEGEIVEDSLVTDQAHDTSPEKQSTSGAASPEAPKSALVKGSKQSRKAEMRNKREKKKEAKAVSANRQSIQVKTMDEFIKELEFAKVKKDLMAHFAKMEVSPPQE
ncbi:unnamed protein product, partial [Mesorhabditis belari]|uniref:Uncharacterized protein n=1 Tax=Mesorhabditis belari TaxID=2138241 RepID=A0AAF3EVM7_9BILA